MREKRTERKREALPDVPAERAILAPLLYLVFGVWAVGFSVECFVFAVRCKVFGEWG